MDVDALWADLQAADKASRRKDESRGASLGSLAKLATFLPADKSECQEAAPIWLEANPASQAKRSPPKCTPSVDASAQKPSPSGADKPSLDDILEARKSQLALAKRTELQGLGAMGVDSDDEEGDGDKGEHILAASVAATSLGRLVNRISAPSVVVRKQAFHDLDVLTAATLASSSAQWVDEDLQGTVDRELSSWVKCLEAEAAAIIRQNPAPREGEGHVAAADASTQAKAAHLLASLLRPLLLAFADASEQCRHHAVRLAGWLLGAADAKDIARALPLLMPVLVECLGTEDAVEPSEEVRLSLAALAAMVVDRSGALVRAHVQALGSIALGCCRDKHPGTMRAGAAIAQVLGRRVLAQLTEEQGAKAVAPFTVGLIDAVSAGLGHRHNLVRLAAIRAVDALVPCGGASSIEQLVGYREPNVVPIKNFYGQGEALVNAFAPLIQDHHRAVRLALLRTCYGWCRSLDYSDLYSQEARLMPYLLSGACVRRAWHTPERWERGSGLEKPPWLPCRPADRLRCLAWRRSLRRG